MPSEGLIEHHWNEDINAVLSVARWLDDMCMFSTSRDAIDMIANSSRYDIEHKLYCLADGSADAILNLVCPACGEPEAVPVHELVCELPVEQAKHCCTSCEEITRVTTDDVSRLKVTA